VYFTLIKRFRCYIFVTYGTTAMSVVRNFVNDPYWLIDFFIFFCCFNATFSNISAILWLPVLVVDVIIDPSFPCRCPLEDAIHYLLQCPLYRNARSRVHLFCNLQSRARTHVVLVIGLYELLGNPTT
jgi:hypothetical protein